ncbi:MAG: hypothetical protein ACM3SY_09795 [Candidatus Omnitrophota bacterium]
MLNITSELLARLIRFDEQAVPQANLNDLEEDLWNETITSLLARCPVPIQDALLASHRVFMMEKRGEGVPIILQRSLELSSHQPEYRLIDDAELLLTIYAAGPTEQWIQSI